MIRRVFALLGGGAALLTFASCSTFETDNAATVNGHDISVDDLDGVRDALAENPASFQLGSESFDTEGEAGGDLTRQALTLLVRNEILRQVLAEQGTTLTQDQIDAAASDMDSSATPPPAAARDAVAFQNAATSALDELPAPDPATLEAAYDQRPASTGIVCLVIYQTASGDDAKAAAAALAAGEPVTESDTTQSDNGCAPVTQLPQAFAAEDMAFFLDGKPGDVSRVFEPDAVNGTSVWQIIQIQPWADAVEQYTQALQQAPGERLLAVAMAAADVSVRSAYGRWDGTSGAVVALTPATAGAA